MAKIGEIVAPRVDTNNEYVTFFSEKQNGDLVDSEEVVASVETAKGTVDCVAQDSGYIYFTVEDGDEIKVGDVIALLSDSQDEGILAESRQQKQDTGSEYQMTEKARYLVQKHHIDLQQFSKDKIIREKDVLAVLTPEFTIAPTMQNKLIILAGGGHAKMCIEIIRQSGQYEILGITDPAYPNAAGVMGVPIIGTDDVLNQYYQTGCRKLINGLGAAQSHHLRRDLFLRYQAQGFEFPNLIHPRAMLEPSVQMGEGNEIMAGAVVGPDVVIGSNCIINSGAIVSHDSKISDHVHIAPGAILAGNVRIGQNTLIGMGVTIYFGVKIGANVTIHNGCNITSDVPDNSVVAK